MPIEFACEDCGSVLRVPDGTSGKRSRCPACSHEQEIPFVVTSADAVAPSGKLSIPCPKCQHHLVCEPELLGTRGQCKKCNHIFTISQEPAPVNDAAPALVFHCPECNQLFEGREDMRGRKGKCHVCQAVFAIQLELATPTQDATIQDALPQDATVPVAAPTLNPPAPQPAPARPAPAQPAPTPLPAPTEQPRPAARSAPESKPAVQLSPRVNDDLGLVEDPTAAAAASKRTRQEATTAKARPVPTVPIRFECAYCQGVMEVPGSTAGMETECPYCQVVLTIPQRSTIVDKPAPVHEANSFDAAFQAAKSQPTYSQSAANDQFSNLDFGGSTNPYAAPTGAWTAAGVSGSPRSNEMTVGNVLQQGFEALFPSCLIVIPLFFITVIPMAIVQIILGVVIAMKLGDGVNIGMSLVVAAIGMILGAWVSGSLSRTALFAVRRKPLSFGQCFDPGGGFAAALFQSVATFLLSLLFYVPALLKYLGGDLIGSWLLPFALFWVVMVGFFMLAFSYFSCLCVPAGVDGEDAGSAISLSISLVLSNFLVTFAVLFITGLITIILILPTLGLAAVLPVYMLASLYNLATK